MKRITVPARPEELDHVLNFINELLAEEACAQKTRLQIEIAAEEIFINIVHYAYAPEVGDVTVEYDSCGIPKNAQISFIDQGKPYNPLEKADPDTTLNAEDRNIGGLGIYLVKKSMDDVIYKFDKGSNILTIKKLI